MAKRQRTSHEVIPSLTRSFTRSFTRSHTLSLSLSLTRSLTRLLTPLQDGSTSAATSPASPPAASPVSGEEEWEGEEEEEGRSPAKRQRTTGNESPAGPPPSWKEAMLAQIARGELPSTDADNAPKSVRKALRTFAADHGHGCIIFATTPESYEALGVPDVAGRAAAGWMVHQLMRDVPDEEKVEKCNLPPPKGSTKYTWWVLSPAGHEALAAHARETTVANLDSAVRVRCVASIRENAMRELADQGIHECPTCYGPVLDPDDPEYEEKDALMQRIGERGAVLTRCNCGHGLCVSG